MVDSNIDESPDLKRQRLERVSFDLLCNIIKAGNSKVLRNKLSEDYSHDLDASTKNSLLITASEEGQLECVKVLLEFGAPVDLRTDEDDDEENDEEWLYRSNAIYAACEKGHFDIVKSLLETDPKAKLNHPEFRPLYEVCRQGHLETAKLLVEHGAELQDDNDEYGSNALMVACGSDSAELVEYLISKGADVNYENKHNPHALLIACDRRNLEMMEVLLKHGAYVDVTELGADSEEDTCLNLACQWGDLDMIRLLVKYKADINAFNRDGDSPFVTAYFKHNDETIDLFLESGMDLNKNESRWQYEAGGQFLPIRDKWTPLMYACSNNDIEMVKRLLALGADVNVMSQSGPGASYEVTTAVLASIDNEEILQVLLDHGADVDLTDRRGNTALISLLTEREEDYVDDDEGFNPADTEPMSPEILNGVRALLDYGLDIMHKNNMGKTALDYVVAGSVIEALLIEYRDRKPLLK